VKIGLLNPWSNAAENQLIPAIARVTASLGHTAVECKNTQDVLAHRPDLVIAMSRTQPKLTHIPTYGLLFDPRDILLERSEYLFNIYSYDGVFTLFDTLKTFAQDLLFAARRDEPVGAFYPTSMTVDWPHPIAFESARLAYFGINWDRRRQELFTRLDGQPWMRIYGPEHGWTFLTGSAYQGSVPFDGISVIRTYHQAGAGLCLFSESHFADDIITSRIFEVCAAGALILAPKMPWLERNFGDCILFIDQHLPDADLAQQIAGHMDWIRQHPAEAAAMAALSAAIFRERFCLEVLLENVFSHHQELQRRQAAAQTDCLVSVIVTGNDTPPEAVSRTLRSVEGQHHQHVEVLTTQASSGSEAAPGGLWEVLAAASGQYVAVVDAGDEWMPNHLSSLLSALEVSPDRRLALSGSVLHSLRIFVNRGGVGDTRRLQPFPFFHPSDDVVRDVMDVPIGSCLFDRALLDRWLLLDPRLHHLNGPYLLLALLEQATPAFTYRATTIHYETVGESNRERDPRHRDDVARLHQRFVGRPFPAASRIVGYEALRQVVQRTAPKRPLGNARVLRHDGVAEYLLPPDFAYTVGPEEDWEPIPLDVSPQDIHCAGETGPIGPDALFPLVVQPPADPWAHGLTWPLRLQDDRPHILRLHCRVERGTAALGVPTWQQQAFAYRAVVPSGDDRVVVSLPIPHPAEAGPVVVQATHGDGPVRIVIEAAQLFASEARLPLTATSQFMQENERLQTTLDAVQQDRDTLAAELGRSRRRVREMRESRVWQLGTLYWRLVRRLNKARVRMRKPATTSG
jgi:hypothetical protein